VVLLGKRGRHNWLIGAATQQDRYDATDLPSFDYAFTTPGLLAQDEIALPENLTLGISARLDWHSQYGTFASPRLSLLYKPVASVTARVSAGTGFFAPTPFVEETEETGLSRVRPMTGIVAERARGVSFDTTWSQGPVEIVGTLFGSHVRQPMQRRFYDESSVELFNAAGPTRTWGTELLARYRIQDFVLLAAHGYTHSTEEDPESPERREVPLTPDHLLSFNAIREGEWGRVGLECYYIGRQPLEENPYRNTGRSYILFGALFEKRFGRVRVFLNLENLGNVRQTHWEPLLRPVAAPDGRWTVDAWAPLDGRVINGGIRVLWD
jgi:iron complex outermembrane receptor protein